MSEKFGPDERRLLGECVAEIADASELVAREMVGQAGVKAGSRMENLLRSNLNVESYGRFPIVREALVDAMFATISGSDHARSWVSLMLEGTATVSTAAVARGALEGLAKAHYLTSATSTAELIQRHLASARFDLAHPLKHSQFVDASGVLIDKLEFPKVHEDIERELGLARVLRPGSQHLVRDLLTAGMRPGEQASAEIYSQLSGPAHAGMSALGMYVIPNTASFALPKIIASEQAGYLFAAICVVAEEWLELFGLPDEGRQAWIAARMRAEQSMSTVIGWY